MTDKKHERTEASPPQPARQGPLDPRWPDDDPRQTMTNPNVPAAPQDSTGDLPSINEPPGSYVAPDSPVNEGQTRSPQASVSHETQELPSDAELERMTRAELDGLAASRGVDTSQASNKDDVIAALRRDARRRHR